MMDRTKTFFTTTVPLLFIVFSSISSSFAALGDVETSVATDQTKIFGAKATRSTTTHENFRMHEMKKNTQTVHEFVSADGKVFAVTWVGAVHPDFSVLFGSYFKDFQAARASAQSSRIRRRSGTLESGDLHIEYGGHMAAQRGRAWVKSILPEGFDTNEIR